MQLKKIVIIGPESTGKSTLSASLAAYYHTAWVPEFARTYLEKLGRPYEQKDLLQMAKGQLLLEEEQMQRARRLLFCDTDLHVIKVWSEHKYGDCDPWILRQISERKYDFYLLTGIDLPWQEDPLREYPQARERAYFYQVYRDIVINSGVPWAEISGSGEQRLQKSVAAVEAFMKGRSK